ncbi:MAG: FecR domain-containing protein [Tannerella sp.]|jgi:ferric-dicitrate binding protein FerR (iron transport regulator)|nr:FecR domain-containing protein [Tannerella sp.]
MDFCQRKQLYRRLLEDPVFFRWLLYPTHELDVYWNNMMQEDSEKEEAIGELKTILQGIRVVEEDLSAEAKEALWQKIDAAAGRKRKVARLKTILRYAAAGCILLAVGLWFYDLKMNRPDPAADYRSFFTDSAALDNLTSGNIVILRHDQEKIEVSETNVELSHDAEGRMSVNSEAIGNKPANKPESDLNRLFVPYGKTTSILMSDGTKIWVNSGSRVMYPSVFAKNKREIYVEGEVFLDVARNEPVPFIVKTDLLEIHVLGTSFNVSAYRNDENQSVVLVTGSVSIKGSSENTTRTILPNQKYVLERNTDTAGVEQVDVVDYICWKYGFLSFRNEKLSAVLKKVERYYNVRIAYDASAIDHTSVSGKLDLKEDIGETFRIIAITAPIEYVIREGEISLHVKP